MAKLLINDTTLSAIGDAIRTKNGGTDTYKPSEMPNAILAIAADGLSHTFSGDCRDLFAGGDWDFVIEQGGVGIQTKVITDATNMFSNSKVTQIPFDINLGYTMIEQSSDVGPSLSQAFYQAQNLVNAPKVVSYKDDDAGHQYLISDMDSMFYNCYALKTIDLSDISWISYRQYPAATSDVGFNYMFYNCFSLRSIDENTLKEMYYRWKVTKDGLNNGRQFMFYCCHCLDELRGVRPVSNDSMASFCKKSSRLKDFIFCEPELDDDGNYYDNFKISLDLSTCGWFSGTTVAGMRKYIGDPNDEKRIIDDATYQALKDDPDAWTSDVKYSRYNKGSALRTIASLPQCGEGYSSTIKFEGSAGSATDDGAINTLTEEEIAVATAKGWTVSLV